MKSGPQPNSLVPHGGAGGVGRRMATCSGDRTVRVWDLDDKGDWIFHSDWQAHKGSVTRLSWAHPEFGYPSSLRNLRNCGC